METDLEKLRKKAFDLRNSQSYEESLLVARAIIQQDPQSSTGYWLVALNNEALGRHDDALEAYEKSLALYDQIGYRWSRYANTLRHVKRVSEAVDAYETALIHDDSETTALVGLSRIYLWDAEYNDKEKAYPYLRRLDEVGELNDFDLINSLGAHHYATGLYLEALRCFLRTVSYENHKYGHFNAGLAYSALGQLTNAVDIWYEGLRSYPDYESMRKSFEDGIKQRKDTYNLDLIESRCLSDKDTYYQYYVNPLQLLNIGASDDSVPNQREIVNAKKKLLQEIDLEDGVISWLSGCVIEKSRAIKIVDELNDPVLFDFHLRIFNSKSLLAFLSIGDINFFKSEPSDDLLQLKLAIESEPDFSVWLRPYFEKQFNEVLTKASSRSDPALMQLLMSGRIWFDAEALENCYAGLKAALQACVDELKLIEEKSEKTPVKNLELMAFIGKNNLLSKLSSCPPVLYEMQDAIVSVVRSIAIDLHNKHGQTDESKKILATAILLSRKKSSAANRLLEDNKALDAQIAEKKQYESHLTFGDVKASVTAEGVKYGDKFIKESLIESIRWGVTITREAVVKNDYLLVVKGSNQEIRIAWRGTGSPDNSKQHFDKLVEAIITYSLPGLIDRVNSRLKRGLSLQIGPCTVSAQGISFESKGWFSAKTHQIPWQSLKATLTNGNLVLSNLMSPALKTELPFSETDNAFVLYHLAKSD